MRDINPAGRLKYETMEDVKLAMSLPSVVIIQEGEREAAYLIERKDWKNYCDACGSDPQSIRNKEDPAKKLGCRIDVKDFERATVNLRDCKHFYFPEESAFSIYEVKFEKPPTKLKVD